MLTDVGTLLPNFVLSLLIQSTDVFFIVLLVQLLEPCVMRLKR